MNDAKFWDRIAGRYARRPVADEAAYERKLQVTRSYLGPDMRLLEIGCGTGSTALAHAPHVQHVRAVDVSAKMIQIAKVKAEAANIRNVTFEQAAIDDLSVPDGSVDAVLALNLLHLLDDLDAAIARIHAMLVPGGIFVSSTMCLGDRMGYLKLIVPVGRLLGLMPHVAVFTAASLRQAMTGAGFEIDHEWQPGDRQALFMVARKSG